MILIPEGEFIMGSDDIKTLGEFGKEFGILLSLFLENEKPVRKIKLKSFYMDKYEATNREYKAFIDATDRLVPFFWIKGKYKKGQHNYPVYSVSWDDANLYCKWAGKRLPTEEEWEKAARGPNGNRYPWGNEFDIKKGNLDQGEPTIVGSMEGDKSYYGVYDMSGNLMEWTASWFKAYTGSTQKSSDYGEIHRVVRGWSWRNLDHYNLPYIFARNTQRHYFQPHQVGKDIGFRCAKD